MTSSLVHAEAQPGHRRQYPAVDLARLVFAVLVIAVHTDPLTSLSPMANYFLVSVLARLGVPFFFLCSGFFLAEKLKACPVPRQRRQAVTGYLGRILILYLGWTVIYLPYFVYIWVSDHGASPDYWLGWLQRFFFSGSYYTLWFLPALLLGIPLALKLHRQLSPAAGLLLCCSLFAVGTLGQSYADLLPESARIASLAALYYPVFLTTRNGLFFGLPFVWLGIFLSRRPGRLSKPAYLCLLLLGLAALTAEAVALHSLEFSQGNGMWFSLLLAVPACFRLLSGLKLQGTPAHQVVRRLSTLLYVSHGLLLVAYAAVGVRLLPDHSLLRFLFVLLGSCTLSLLLLQAGKRYHLLRLLG